MALAPNSALLSNGIILSAKPGTGGLIIVTATDANGIVISETPSLGTDLEAFYQYFIEVNYSDPRPTIIERNYQEAIQLEEVKVTPKKLEETRQEEAVARQQAQETTQSQQIPESVIEDSTPEQVKPKGKNKLGQRILSLGNQVLKLIITKLQSLIGEYLLDQFIQARNNALTPEQITQVKEQYCPAPDVLNQLIETRNNIVNQLNSIGNRLNLANQTVNGLTTTTNTSQDIINLASSIQTGLNLAASSGLLLGPSLGPVLSNYNSIEKIIQTVSPLISSNNNALYATSIPLGVVSFVITKAIELLGLLDVLINFCSTDENQNQLTPVSNTIQQVTIRQVQANIDSGSYNGFIIKIEEVPFSPTVIRKKAVAFNQSGIALLETPLSFTTNEQTLINELKLIIDRDNLRSY
jgi:hypothetical protein